LGTFDRMNAEPWRLAVGLLLFAAACMSNPSIDGSTVPKIGSDQSPASCADLCVRMRRLCGYAPLDCVTEDGGGYCEQQFDAPHRVCVGQSSSCKDALDCANDETEGGSDAAADALVPDAGGDDAADTDAAADANGQ